VSEWQEAAVVGRVTDLGRSLLARNSAVAESLPDEKCSSVLRGCSSFNSCIATILAYRQTGTKLEMIVFRRR